MKKMFIFISVMGIITLGILFAIGLTAYNTLAPGYKYENGTWNYVVIDLLNGTNTYPLEDVDADSFRKIRYKDFGADDYSVYHKSRKIQGADPKTFEVIYNKGRYHYAKDKNNVYVYVRDDAGVFKIYGADPDTFEVLEFPYAKDKNDAYNGCLPLYVDDVTKFRVIEGSGVSQSTAPEAFLGPVLYSEDVVKYNNEKYGYVTEGVMYSNEGKAQTDMLVYKGYILAEDNRK